MRVCVIGAGPSGLSVLYNWAKLKCEGVQVPDVVCYEKQERIGGLWNRTWMTDCDKNSEACHSSVYSHMRLNNPKEAIEYADYTFDQHFGKPTPSFLPAPLVRDYLQGRVSSSTVDILKQIQFNTVVMDVAYDDDADTFTVTVRNCDTDSETRSKFTHVIVASGVYHTPRYPSPAVPGIESFPGRILHSHTFRNGNEFAGQRVLLIGAKISAEDIALHLIKYGASHVTMCYIAKPSGLIFPSGIEERPPIERIENKMAYFSDGSVFEADSIIICTGYLLSFPFLRDNLRYDMNSKLSLYPDLYKGTVWIQGGNGKLFYCGMWVQLYSFIILETQALWTWKFILGEIGRPSKDVMLADVEAWKAKVPNELTSLSDGIVFLSAFMDELCRESGGEPVNRKTDTIMKCMMKYRDSCIATYKDMCYKSVFTDTLALSPAKPWMEDYDDEDEVLANELIKFKDTL